MSSGLCLDTGALIAVERASARMLRLLEVARAAGMVIDIPAPVAARAWRGGRRQARLARLLKAEGIGLVPLDAETARAVGELCAFTGADDVVDGHVALHARRQDLAVVTSDPADIEEFSEQLDIITI